MPVGSATHAAHSSGRNGTQIHTRLTCVRARTGFRLARCTNRCFAPRTGWSISGDTWTLADSLAFFPRRRPHADPSILPVLAALALLASRALPRLRVQPASALRDGREPGEDSCSRTSGPEVGRGTVTVRQPLFRDLKQGHRYRILGGGPCSVRAGHGARFRDHPIPFYGYYARRGFVQPALDGTLLAAMVRPRCQRLVYDRFPTVIEYSSTRPPIPQPAHRRPHRERARFAPVVLNMRARAAPRRDRPLDLPATADGYDIVETVAAQSWVLHGKPVMVVISFPGISTLRRRREPRTCCHHTVSVLADIYRAPGLPGAAQRRLRKSWLPGRKNDAAPAPAGVRAGAQAREQAIRLASQHSSACRRSPARVPRSNRLEPAMASARRNWWTTSRCRSSWRAPGRRADRRRLASMLPACRKATTSRCRDERRHTSSLDRR